jgi:hypothetical protein
VILSIFVYKYLLPENLVNSNKVLDDFFDSLGIYAVSPYSNGDDNVLNRFDVIHSGYIKEIEEL